MNLQSQVASLDLSRKLKELGIKQESLFWWSICHDCEKEYPAGSVIWALDYGKQHGENISAFTASELYVLIPAKHCNFYKNESGYVFSLFGEPNTYDVNLANCIAKMLIHLIENGLIEVPK